MTNDDEPAVGRVEPRARWRGVLREFATIVAGVLVALAAQAWWERQQDRERERSYLRQLLEDTRVNERRIASAIREDSRVKHAVTHVTEALYAPRPLPGPDSLRALFAGGLFAASNLETRSGTLAALINSGDIRLVHNDSLRAAIVAYSAALENDSELFRLFSQQAFGDPGRIARVLPMARRIQLSLPDSEARLLRERDGRELVTLRDNAELAGVLFSLQVANSNRLAHLKSQLQRTTQLRHRLEAEGIDW